MDYIKKEFKAGDILSALDLNNMGDGIEEAINLAQESAAGAANMEKGAGVSATQQLQNQESGVTEGYFNFVGKNPAAIAADPSLNAELKYGAVGDYSASFGGKSTAIGKRALSEGTTTVAKGAYSHAEGNNSVTLGANSHAEGKCTVTIGENSHSEGYETIAGEFNSHAEGYKTIAKGSAAHAEGQETKAYSHQSHAEGLRTVAGDETNPEIGSYAHAEGQDTIAKGEASHAAGIGTIAAGRAQTVVGRYNVEIPDAEDGTSALFIVGNGNGIPGSENERDIAFAVLSTGEACTTFMGRPSDDMSLINLGQLTTLMNEQYFFPLGNGNGVGSIVGGIDSIADYRCDFTFGEGLRNTFEHQAVFGRFNDNSYWGDNKPLFMIGNGTDTDHRSNAFEVRNNGLVVVGNKVQQLPRADKVTKAEGEEFPHFSFTGHPDAGMAGRIQYGAVGDYAASMNGRSAALNKHAFAINNSTVAKGEESFAQGYETIAEGNSSFAGGSGTYAKGKASVALGISTKASGDYSFATGVHSSATNEASFAEGHRTESLGIASHAEGSETEAKGTCSHAQNANTHAIADYSTATGIETVAEGIASFTAGRGTKATVDSQMVVGRYNVESEDLFVVGTGTDKDNPYTAFSIGADGSVKVTKSPSSDNEVVRLGDMNIRKGPLSSVQQKGATVTENIDSAAAFNQGKAKSNGAFAIGDSTASGWLSTATGYGTEAGSSASFTAGQGTKTTIDCQVAIGTYNVGTKAIFEIGNGSGDTKRSNAFEVYSNGDIGIYKDGKIYSLQKMLAAYFTDANLK